MIKYRQVKTKVDGGICTINRMSLSKVSYPKLAQNFHLIRTHIQIIKIYRKVGLFFELYYFLCDTFVAITVLG